MSIQHMHSGFQENMMVCDVPLFTQEVLHENQSDLRFGPICLAAEYH